MGGKSSQSTSSSGSGKQISGGINQSGQQVWGPQGDALSALYDQVSAQMNPAAWQQASNVYGDRTQQLSKWGDQAISGLQGYNPQQQIAAQTNSLSSGINNLVQQNLSTIGGNASAAGAFGGARHGIAEGAAIGEGARAFTEGLGDITARANQQGILANQSIGSMLPVMQQMQGNVGTYGQQMTFNPLQAAAGIFGTGPQALNFSQAMQYALNQSKNKSEGESSSWNVDNFFGTIF